MAARCSNPLAERVPAYRVVALDLDGTTVRSDGTIGERTRAALRRVESRDVVVMVVTGRPARWLLPVLDALGPEGLAICANGAVVVDIATGDVVREWALGAEVIERLVTDLAAAIPGLHFGVERTSASGFVREPGYVARLTPDATVLRSRADLYVEPAVKLLARHDTLNADDLLAAARAVVESEAATLTHSSRDGLLEISAAGVSKATTLAALCAERGVAAEQVLAFGDMPNDIPLLTWAGHSVAVANAHPEVLAIADEVTASNDAEGVADVLDRLWPPA